MTGQMGAGGRGCVTTFVRCCWIVSPLALCAGAGGGDQGREDRGGMGQGRWGERV